jgi:hypothetical protein
MTLPDSRIVAQQIVCCQVVRKPQPLSRWSYPVFRIGRRVRPAIRRLSAGMRTPRQPPSGSPLSLRPLAERGNRSPAGEGVSGNADPGEGWDTTCLIVGTRPAGPRGWMQDRGRLLGLDRRVRAGYACTRVLRDTPTPRAGSLEIDEFAACRLPQQPGRPAACILRSAALATSVLTASRVTQLWTAPFMVDAPSLRPRVLAPP